MKTAIWLYLFMFIAIFDLHAQYPILSPFALSIGATPSFIGLMMGVYSITHLPGNIIAGIGVDRFGSKIFIVISLVAAGVVLLAQARVTDPWNLLIIRSISGFVLAFLSPACMSLLAKLAKDRLQQGNLMSGNGLVHTLASVVSPAAGAVLVAKAGFAASFNMLGWLLIATGVVALFFVRDVPPGFAQQPPLPDAPLRDDARAGGSADARHAEQAAEPGDAPIPWLFYGIPLAIACSQGILYFELPLLEQARQSLLASGLMFSVISLGALLTLSMLFLNRYSSYTRTVIGSFLLALTFFGMAIKWPMSLSISLFVIGMAKGVIFPAMSTLLAALSSANRYGRAFSYMAISSSLGAFIGPILAGQLREHISPYYIAFVILMLALSILPLRLAHTLAMSELE